MNTIAKPFGWLLMWLYELVNNYGIAIILFALAVKLILLPFMVKSKKSTLRMSSLQPQMDELKKKHGANNQKYNEEVQKLYAQEHINPTSGCIWTLIPFPILIALYYAIRYPLTIMMRVPADLIAEGGAILSKLNELGFSTTLSDAYKQIAQAQFISNNFDKFSSLSDKLRQIDFSFFGINLGSQPNWKFWKFDFSNKAALTAELLLILIPVCAAILTYVSQVIAAKINPNTNAETASTMKTMNIIMPIFTLWFGFSMPAAVSIYWAASMAFGIVQDCILNKVLRKDIDREIAERKERERLRAIEMEEKRKELERIKAENPDYIDKNTSKRKQQAIARQRQNEKTAEWERKNGIVKKKSNADDDDNPSRIGDRRYARGRAYDPNRYGISSASVEAEETPEEPVSIPNEDISNDSPAETEPDDILNEDIEEIEEEISEDVEESDEDASDEE